MDLLNGIVTHTPVWVWAVFALLIFLGLQASRPRTVRLQRLLITPAVFITWGIVSLATKPNFSVLLAADWLVTAVIGGGLAILLVRFPAMQADRHQHRVHIRGSYLPLIRNVAIFVAKFALGTAAAIAPEARDHIAVYDIAVSGLSAGYFLGWLIRLLGAYRYAPPLSPSALPGGAS
jgi:hypothetical protein